MFSHHVVELPGRLLKFGCRDLSLLQHLRPRSIKHALVRFNFKIDAVDYPERRIRRAGSRALPVEALTEQPKYIEGDWPHMGRVTQKIIMARIGHVDMNPRPVCTHTPKFTHQIDEDFGCMPHVFKRVMKHHFVRAAGLPGPGKLLKVNRLIRVALRIPIDVVPIGQPIGSAPQIEPAACGCAEAWRS